MDQVHLHLMLTHFPIVGTVLGLLVMLAGFLFKQEVVKKTALWIFILCSLIAIPAFLTGEEAEHVAEKLQGVSELNIEAHEEIAEVYIWIIAALGVISIITFLFDFYRSTKTVVLYALTIMIAIVAIIISYRVGNFGGEIRHTEIQKNSIPAKLEKEHDEKD